MLRNGTFSSPLPQRMMGAHQLLPSSLFWNGRQTGVSQQNIFYPLHNVNTLPQGNTVLSVGHLPNSSSFAIFCYHMSPFSDPQGCPQVLKQNRLHFLMELFLNRKSKE